MLNKLESANVIEQKEFPQDSFERVMAKMKANIGEEVFQSWFGRLKFESYENKIIRLSVPTSFLKCWINNHYNYLLLKFFQEEATNITRVEISVRSVGKAFVEENKKPKIFVNVADLQNKKPALARNDADFTLGSPLDENYSFESFIEGGSNRLAYAAALTVAEAGGNHQQLNPLFIHASVGLGKTHLLQAIAHKAKNTEKYRNVVYLTAEYFMWKFATAIRDNKALSLKEKLRDIHLLIIDDLQFLQGKSIQNEFCHLLNMLLDSAKQVVVAADRPPMELESLDPRVRSRLQRGVTLSIVNPDYDMRLAILRNRLQLARQTNPKLKIDDVKLEHIANNVSGSGRDLEGVFNQILFRQSFDGEVTIDQIDDLLSQMHYRQDVKRIKIEEIQQIVARHYNLSRQDLLSSRRLRTIVKPRQVAMYLAKMLTPRSLPEIGRSFGGRDHTTVLHAIRKIETQIDKDNKLGKELELLKRLISENI